MKLASHKLHYLAAIFGAVLATATSVFIAKQIVKFYVPLPQSTVPINCPPAVVVNRVVSPSSPAPVPTPVPSGVDQTIVTSGPVLKISPKYKAYLVDGPGLTEVMKSARSKPVIGKDQKIHGWKLDRILPNSFFQKVGFKDNDVVRKINGTELGDALQVISFLKSSKTANHFKIEILRNGERFLEINAAK